MRRYFERIRVETDRRGTPARFTWRGRTFIVSRVLERWRYGGKWWLGSLRRERQYYRVEARMVFERGVLGEARIIEVFREGDAGRHHWTLSYLCD